RSHDTLVARDAPQISNADRSKPPRYVLDIRDTNGDVRLDPETGKKLPRPVGALLRGQSEDQNPSSVTYSCDIMRAAGYSERDIWDALRGGR
ncbi:hypothetical protein LTR60_000472, partial [Cryomyces antarcticus]